MEKTTKFNSVTEIVNSDTATILSMTGMKTVVLAMVLEEGTGAVLSLFRHDAIEHIDTSYQETVSIRINSKGMYEFSVSDNLSMFFGIEISQYVDYVSPTYGEIVRLRPSSGEPFLDYPGIRKVTMGDIVIDNNYIIKFSRPFVNRVFNRDFHPTYASFIYDVDVFNEHEYVLVSLHEEKPAYGNFFKLECHGSIIRTIRSKPKILAVTQYHDHNVAGFEYYDSFTDDGVEYHILRRK